MSWEEHSWARTSLWDRIKPRQQYVGATQSINSVLTSHHLGVLLWKIPQSSGNLNLRNTGAASIFIYFCLCQHLSMPNQFTSVNWPFSRSETRRRNWHHADQQPEVFGLLLRSGRSQSRSGTLEPCLQSRWFLVLYARYQYEGYDHFFFLLRSDHLQANIVPQGIADTEDAVKAANQQNMTLWKVSDAGGAVTFEISSSIEVNQFAFHPPYSSQVFDVTAQKPIPEDKALFLHTSGTTSKPKGVPLTHHNLSVSLSNIAQTSGTRTPLPNLT